MVKVVDRDQSQLFLLPEDMREWVPEDDLAHFVLEAVEPQALPGEWPSAPLLQCTVNSAGRSMSDTFSAQKYLERLSARPHANWDNECAGADGSTR